MRARFDKNARLRAVSDTALVSFCEKMRKMTHLNASRAGVFRVFSHVFSESSFFDQNLRTYGEFETIRVLFEC